ncbi:TonB-dependent receptor [candidate division KSB1 bacterium]|nr:TonB-dependent receptor [candidate division KSB1 bacterium]
MRIFSLFSLLLLALTPAELYAQKTGVIVGTVIDKQTNEPLVGANVVVLGTQLGGATNIDGKFRIQRVPVGIYAVRALVIGYEPVTKTDVVVSPMRDAQLDFSMNETVIKFDELTVRPDYFESSSEKPISTRLQSNEEIRRLPGGLEDVVRAVSILPGVAQVDGGRNDLIVRGGAPSENLYVVDGFVVPNINHFGTQGAAGGPQSFINLDFIETTAFSTGGFGVRYGDRLSSVLTLNLREGRRDRLGSKATISATQFGLDIEGPATRRGSFLFSARRSYLDFIFKASGFSFVPEYWDFLGKTVIDLGVNDKITLLGIAALNDVKLFNDTAEKRYNNSRILVSDQDQFIGGAAWKRIFRGGFTTLSIGYTDYRFNFEQSDTLSTALFSNRSSESETTLDAGITLYPFSGTELTAGVQGKWIRYGADIELSSVPSPFGPTPALKSRSEAQARKSALWGQWSQQWNRLRLIAGARIDAFDRIESSAVVSPRLSLRYQLSESVAVNASTGRYRQTPAYIWVAANPENRRLDYLGADQFIVGLERRLREDLKASLEIYQKNYFDYPVSLVRPYLVMANTGAGFGGLEEGFASFGIDPLVSRGSGRSRGAEFFVQKKLSPVPVYGTFSLTYNRSTYTALDGIVRPGSFDQRWIVNLGGGYVPNEKWEFSLKFRYATGRPYTPYDTDFNRPADFYNSARVAANHFLDLRVDRRWYFDGWGLIAYIDIQNVYNRLPNVVPRYDAYEDRVQSTGQIGILPSLGLSIEY